MTVETADSVVLSLMKFTRRTFILIILVIIAICIHVLGTRTGWVENQYSNGIYPRIAVLFRLIFSPLPFSLGDILYGIGLIWLAYLLFKTVKFFVLLRKTPFNIERRKIQLYRLFCWLAGIYIVFNLLWGLNYDRVGIASQLGLDMKKYTTDDLKQMNCLLLDKINNSKQALIRSGKPYPSDHELFERTARTYRELAAKLPFLEYQHPSIKTALWGWLGNYAGFTGYYNPFTGEAQVNTTVPKFLQPYTACHEVAHQVGYAKEMEANFVGYLAASQTTDTLFHYSVYMDLFTYANRNLYMVDSMAANLYRKELIVPVVNDIREWIRFSRQHQSYAGPAVRWLYSKYLQGNRQPQGIMSYDEVTGFLIAYYKKFGRI